MSEMLRLEEISKSFPGVRALKNVNFSLKRGEIHALVGENGAGKSTLVKIISGVYKADSGRIFFENKKVKIDNANDAVFLGISTVHQSLVVFPDLTVLENLFIDNYSSSKGLIKWKVMREKAVHVMNEFGIHLSLDQEARTLSAPAQKLLQILRALLKKAKVLILDEPTAALTVDETELLFKNVKKLKNRGIGVIYISHLLEEIFQLADKVTVLRNGEVVTSQPLSELTLADIVKNMIGKELRSYYPKRESKPGPVILTVRNLRKGILKNISLKLRKGEILGIAGILGAGRTTLAKVLFGILKPDKGTILLNGKEIKIKTPLDAIDNGIVYVPEDKQRQGLILRESVRFNISIANLKTITKHGILDLSKENFMVNKAIHDFEIDPPFPGFQVLHLSGGNQQKVVIAKWSVRNASIIIMDEPTQGIDVGSKSQMYNLMSMFAKDGKAIILISSDFNELINMCDRIIVLRKGMVSGELDKSEFSIDKVIYLSTK